MANGAGFLKILNGPARDVISLGRCLSVAARISKKSMSDSVAAIPEADVKSDLDLKVGGGCDINHLSST